MIAEAPRSGSNRKQAADAVPQTGLALPGSNCHWITDFMTNLRC